MLQWTARGGLKIRHVAQYLSFTATVLIITSRTRGGGYTSLLKFVSNTQPSFTIKHIIAQTARFNQYIHENYFRCNHNFLSDFFLLSSDPVHDKGNYVVQQFLNLFSEVKPSAAILIAHRTYVFFGGTPEARRAEIRGQKPREKRGFWGGGRESRPQIYVGRTNSLENLSTGCKCRTQFNFFTQNRRPAEP